MYLLTLKWLQPVLRPYNSFELYNVQVIAILTTKWTFLSTRQSIYIIQCFRIRAEWAWPLSLSENLTVYPTFWHANLKMFKPAVESAVTRLLVSIKQLLEALTLWSQLRMDEEGVSNVYVQLGNDFNEAVAAFSAFNIDMMYVLNCRLLSVYQVWCITQGTTLSPGWSKECFRAMPCGRCHSREPWLVSSQCSPDYN